ncbi:MAG: protein-L-isoaspartate(D-aspartate) O-methyltransferase [Verrucomicrobia bacterium]|nr:protein-L-isoaspartate(D-aspartate) O-methyltransferase [Verrucomicrobiota bacterium]
MNHLKDTYRHQGKRKLLVEELEKMGISDARVLRAFNQVPRHFFMDLALDDLAYTNGAFHIGSGQTISHPYTVAFQTELLELQGKMKVLEIGTGCGYQAAVLSLLAKEVYSIERIRPLHDLARNKLRPFRIANLRLIYGDGIRGLPQAAPFDAIILAAAGLGVPDPLLDQLAIGGRLIAPVSKSETEQQLLLIERVSSHRYQRTALDEVFFVPLQSGVI